MPVAILAHIWILQLVEDVVMVTLDKQKINQENMFFSNQQSFTIMYCTISITIAQLNGLKHINKKVDHTK